MIGKLFFTKRVTPFKATSFDYRLQYKPNCYFTVAEGLENELIEIELKYADDNEDFVYSKAKAFGWKMISRDTYYEKQEDFFKVETPANGEMQALDQLSKEPRVVCASRVNAEAGAPALEVRNIPLGTVLGSPMALPVVGLPIVREWLANFYKGSRVEVGEVNLGNGAEYFVSIIGPGTSIKFDDDDTAWVQLDLDLRVGSNIDQSSKSFVASISVQIQDASRAKAPGNGPKPPPTLFGPLKYWTNGAQSSRSDWGKKMDRWQRIFSTYLAGKYKGQLVGGQ